MSCFILVFSLLVMFIMAYVVEEKDILSPFVISVAMFLISSLVALIYLNKWQFSLSYTTVVVIVTAILVFGMGNCFAEKVCKSLFSENQKSIRKLERVDINIFITCIFTVAMLVFLYKAINEIYAVSISAGNPGGYREMLTYARRRVIATDYHRSRVLNYILVMSQAIVYIYGWALVKNIVSKKFKKKDILYVIPIVIAFFTYAIGTVKRGFVIEWFAYFFVLYFLMQGKKNQWKPLNALKIVALGTAVLVLFLIMFAIMGVVAGRFGNTSIIDTIAFYIGLSIPSLDAFIKSFTEPMKTIGGETLYGIYAILNKLRITNVDTYTSLEFISFNNVKGNVYTSLRRYINDYGFIGMYIIQFYLGVFWGGMYNFIKKTSNEALMIIYSLLGYALVMQGIDELILGKYISINTINLLLFMGAFYLILTQSGKLKKGLDKII